MLTKLRVTHQNINPNVLLQESLCSLQKQNCTTSQSTSKSDFCLSLQSVNQANQKKILNKNKQSQKFNELFEKLKTMQQNQAMIKAKYQTCISSLERQLKAKQSNNNKLADQIKRIKAQINQQKQDIQVIKSITLKLRAKKDNPNQKLPLKTKVLLLKPKNFSPSYKNN